MGSANETILSALVYGYTICVMLGLGASINLDIREEVRKVSRRRGNGRHVSTRMPCASFPFCC